MPDQIKAPQPAPGRFWVEYDNDTGPGDGALIEWWSVVDEQSGDTLCKCDSQASADRIAAMLNHGGAIPAPEGAPLPPLPEPHWPRGYQGSVPSGGYTADQMHAYARAALAAPAPQAAPVALTDEQVKALEWHLSAERAYEAYTGQESLVVEGAADFARAAVSEFCRVNGIPAPKEPKA